MRISKTKVRSWEWYDEIWKNVGKCVFCDLREKYIVFEKNGVVLTANLYPYTDGHLLIVPRRHVEYLKQLTPQEWETIRAIVYVAKKILRKYLGVKNVWFLYREGPLGQAQKTVGHLHIHVVPYKDGLMSVNYQPIHIDPKELKGKLKERLDYPDKLFDKFLGRYGKNTCIERRVVVGAVVFNSKREVLLVKKEHSAYPGTWSPPSGSVEQSESLEAAIKREVKEETGLTLRKIEFVGIDEDMQNVIFQEGYTKKWNMIFINYRASVKNTKLVAGDDAAEARWVKPEMLKKYKLTSITEKLFKKIGLL